MTDSDVRDLVDRALLPLKAVNEELHAHAVGYVVDGETPQVLFEIIAFGGDPGDCLLSTGPGASFCSSRPDGALRTRLRAVGIRWTSGDRSARPVLAPRDDLYRSDAVSLAQWVRLGRLLDSVRRAGADRGSTGSMGSTAPERVPGWLRALLIDVLGTVDSRGIDRRDKAVDARAERLGGSRPGWDARRLAALLRREGFEDRDVPAVLLLAAYGGATGGSWAMSPSPADLPGVADYLVEHAGALSGSLMDVLRPEERRDVLARMTASPRWTEAGAHPVAALSVGASKELRWEAVDVLSELDRKSVV